MAEMLGTVVGVVSLGLQVCSGITKYLDGIQSHRGDVASASRLCHTLRSRLYQMEAMKTEIAAAIDGPALAIDEAMAPVKAELIILSAFVEKIRTSDDPSRSVGERIRDGTKRAGFPFRRGHLEHLESHLREADRLLQAALHIDEVRILMKSGTGIRSIDTKLSNLNTEVNRKMDSMLQQSQLDVEFLSSEVSQISLEVGTYMEASTIQLSRIESQVSEVLQALYSPEPEVILRRMLSKPGALQMICSGVGLDGPPTVTTNSLRTLPTNHRVNKPHFGVCHCKPRRTRITARQALGPAFFVKEDFSGGSHAPDCPLHDISPSKKSWSLGISTNVFQSVLSTAITVSMFSPYGAGGLSITTLFKMHFVRRQSPANKVINVILESSVLGDEDFSLVLQRGIRTLQWIFKAGKASPFDVNENDQTLLHAACSLPGMMNLCGVRKMRPLQQFLVAAGVPQHHAWEYGELPLHMLFTWAAHFARNKAGAFVRDNDLGIESMAHEYRFLMPDDLSVVSNYRSKSCEGSYVAFYDRLFLGSPEITEWHGNLLHTAIIEKDRMSVMNILQNESNATRLSERNTFGFTALELLAHWPEGLDLVLQSLGNKLVQDADMGDISVLCCALNRSRDICTGLPGAMCPNTCICTGNVSRLLEANCLMKLNGHWLRSLGVASVRCREIVIQDLKRRRGRLVRLALAQLSPAEIIQLEVSECNLLDSRTQEVVDALQRRGIEVPKWLKTDVVEKGERSSVYQLVSGDPILVEAIHSAGFEELDTVNSYGYTPIMNARLLAFIYLTQHGADPARQIPNHVTGYTATHNAFNVFPYEHEAREICRTLLHDYGELTQEIQPEDGCECECSLNGCKPYTMMCKSILDDAEIKCDNDSWSGWTVDGIANMMTSVLEDGWDLGNEFKAVALRVATFEALSIRHTCCDFVGEDREVDADEPGELWEEDGQKISKLHALLSEFEEKLAEIGCSLPTFLITYWRERMFEAIDELEWQPLTEENLRGIREMGIEDFALDYEDEEADDYQSEYEEDGEGGEEDGEEEDEEESFDEEYEQPGPSVVYGSLEFYLQKLEDIGNELGL